jgi:hypothetical protein
VTIWLSTPHPGLSSYSIRLSVINGKDCDLEFHWDVVESSWYEIFARVKFNVVYRARIMFDEVRHEVR